MGPTFDVVTRIILAASPSVAILAVAIVIGTFRDAGSVAAIGLTTTANRVAIAARKAARTAAGSIRPIYSTFVTIAFAICRAVTVLRASLCVRKHVQQHEAGEGGRCTPSSGRCTHRVDKI
jgi:hypothetical protein